MAPSPRSRLAVSVAYLLTLAAPSGFAGQNCGPDAPSLGAEMMTGYAAAPRHATLERLQHAPNDSCAGLVRGFLEEYQQAVNDWHGKPGGDAELVGAFNRVADALGGGVDDYRPDYFGGFGRSSHAAAPKTLDEKRLEARFTRRQAELKAAFASAADAAVPEAAASRKDVTFTSTSRASILQRLSALKIAVPPVAHDDGASQGSTGGLISGSYHKVGLGSIAGGVLLGGLMVVGAVPATLTAGVAVVVLVVGGAAVYAVGKPAGSIFGRVTDVFQGRF